MIINEGDILEKRKGFVRGLNEQFTGVVCGLFKYTDDCGVEWILVADQEMISIRQPFVIPTFTQSDAYPFDSFFTDPISNVGDVDLFDWRNTGRYTLRTGKLVEVSTNASLAGDFLDGTDLLRWFKEATNLSYQVRIEYEFEFLPVQQHQAVIIKGNGDLLTGAYLQAEMVYSQGGVYEVRVFLRAASRELTQIATATVFGSEAPPTGFLTLRYTRDLTAPSGSQFIVLAEVNPIGGSTVFASSFLNGLQDADLGQISGTGVGHRSGALSLNNGVKVIDGGPV
ncbi:MAG: hypothetical protein V3R87_12005 [Dehalococcoidia bacterium]